MGASSSSLTLKGEQAVAQLQAGDSSQLVAAIKESPKVAKRALVARNGDTGLHILAGSGSAEGLSKCLDAYLLAMQRKSKHWSADLKAHYMSELINIPNDKGRTPLMAACKGGHADCVSFLLQNQANPELRDRAGAATAAHYAAAAGHENVLRLLAGHRTAAPGQHNVVDMGDANGLTPLHYAAFFKRHRVVTVLCELGASLYAASIWAATSAMVDCSAGSTPLHLAAASGSVRTVKSIMSAYATRAAQALEPGAPAGATPPPDPRLIQDKQGSLPFLIALQRSNVRVLPLLHPLTPLAELFASDRPEDRAVGVPRLIELTSMAAQKVLMAQLEQIASTATGPSRAASIKDAPLGPASTKASSRRESWRETGGGAAPAPQGGPGTPGKAAPPPPSGVSSQGSLGKPPVARRLSSDHHASSGAAPGPKGSGAGAAGGSGASAGDAAFKSQGDAAATSPFAAGGTPSQGQQQTQAAPGRASPSTSTASFFPPQTGLRTIQEPAGNETSPREDQAQTSPTGPDRATAPSNTFSALVLAGQRSPGSPEDDSQGGSWVQRRGAWRAKLHGLPLHGKRGAGTQTPEQWMQRRSAWRAQLIRHQQQLLASASAEEQAAAGDNPTQGADHSSITASALAELKTLAAGGAGRGAALHARLQPSTAHTLRLLGLDTLLHAKVNEHEEDNQAHDAVDGMLGAAIDMLRMHRLTQGVGMVPEAMGPEHGRALAAAAAAGGVTVAGTSTSWMLPQGSSFGSGSVLVTEQLGQRPPSARGSDSGRLVTATSTRDLIAVSVQPTSQLTAVALAASAGAAGPHSGSGANAFEGLAPRQDSNNSVGTQGGGLPALPPAPGTPGSVGPGGVGGGGGGPAPMLGRARSARMSAGRSTAGSEGWADACGVCLESGVFLALQKCNHKLCLTCARELVRLHDLKPALCPFCRRVIQGFRQPGPA